ncbi:hypothetical protein L596_019074 [Steinernema carpocapsae]|uniref:R3H domain-containing protein n=1 Tax=Steinernema carpocapsae TaxID=34508 RepID=A0A4V6A2G1_STECR|nr:hypothetical protein L596_019074 [Steinernema carpocapsae]
MNNDPSTRGRRGAQRRRGGGQNRGGRPQNYGPPSVHMGGEFVYDQGFAPQFYGGHPQVHFRPDFFMSVPQRVDIAHDYNRPRGNRAQNQGRPAQENDQNDDPGRNTRTRGGRAPNRGRSNRGRRGQVDQLQNILDENYQQEDGTPNESNEDGDAASKGQTGRNNERRNGRRNNRKPSRPNPQHVHNLPPKEKIEMLLRTDKYECAICLKNIRRNQFTFSCQQCYQIFHISRNQTEASKSGTGCLTEWAFTSYSTDDGWQCPHCKFQYFELPTKYKCFCGKKANPPTHGVNSPNVPHGCGEICGKQRAHGCPHSCIDICHPGPCEPCPAMKVIKCGCGGEEKAVRCGTITSFQCQLVCGKQLKCGQHLCEELCHEGDCATCEERIKLVCYCGSETKSLPCSKENHSKERSYSCGQACLGMFSCGVHLCDKKCHKPIKSTDPCGTCKFDPEGLMTCPCGNSLVADLLDSPRQSCEDPIPTCDRRCLKVLPCSILENGVVSAKSHRCENVCHEGDCAPCKAESSITCRCKSLTKDIPCMERCLYDEGNQFLCERRCRKGMSCQKHKCQERCCIRDDHLCLQICGKTLECGLHTCDRLCHIGQCYRCLEASFEEQYCMCGKTVRLPPVPCGSPLPICHELCSRPHPCGHQQSHTCHADPECPPCTYLVSKYCFGEHEIRNNIPCYQNHVSCGNPCDKPLPCGVHKCKKACHKGECASPTDMCRQPCPGVRENECGHFCGLPCHGTELCKPSSCCQIMEIRCPCGRLKADSKCFDVEREYKRKLAAKIMEESEQGGSTVPEENFAEEKCVLLQCDAECKRLIRNRKLFEALELDKCDKDTYSDYLLEQANRDDQFVTAIEAVFAEIIGEVQKNKREEKVSHVFYGLPADRRKIVHEYAPFFKIETKSTGVGAQRNTWVFARKTCVVPGTLLSSYRGKKSCYESNSGEGMRRLEGPSVVRRL